MDLTEFNETFEVCLTVGTPRKHTYWLSGRKETGNMGPYGDFEILKTLLMLQLQFVLKQTIYNGSKCQFIQNLL